MAVHRFVTIQGQRFEITDAPIIDERSCDRCGSFMRHRTNVQVPQEINDVLKERTLVELCDMCVNAAFPGLIDLAIKVSDRD